MTYKTKPITLSTNETKFLTGMSKMANEFEIPPARAVEIMGVMVNLMLQFEHEKYGTEIKTAVTAAVALFMKGLGAEQTEIDVVVEQPDQNKDLH